MSTKQPLSKNRFKALRIPWRKNLNKILGKSDVDNVDDRQSVICDLKRDNQLLDIKNPGKNQNKIEYLFNGPFGIDTYRKIVHDYHRGCNVGSNRCDETLSKSLQRGELVNLQKTTMRKQLPNEDDANYLQYQLTVNQKYSTNVEQIEDAPQNVEQHRLLGSQIPLHLSNSEDNPDVHLFNNDEIKTWDNTLENLKNQLQMLYEDDISEGSECYNDSLDNDDNNTYHSISLHEADQNKPNNDENIQTFPTAITLNWNHCKVTDGPQDDEPFPDPGDSSQSFNRTLQNILCDGDSLIKNDMIFNSPPHKKESDIGKKYFTNHVLPEMKEHKKIARENNMLQTFMSTNFIATSPPPNIFEVNDQNILREELHRVYGEINQLKSICSTFAENMAKFSYFQDEIKKMFEQKFPDPRE